MNALGDFRHAARVLARTPVFTVSAVLVLALGIGATTAVFGLLHALLFKPLPYAHADRLMMVWEHNVPRNRPRNVVSSANFLEWRERNRSFAEMALFSTGISNLTGTGEPEELRGIITTANLLPMVGAQPIRGRLLEEGDDEPGAPRVVVISDGLWHRRFGSRADIVGQAITLGGSPTTIVGVLPSQFELFGQHGDFWAPFVFQPQNRRFSGRGFLSAGLLKPGVTRDQAQADLAGIAAQLAVEHPDFDTGWTVNVVPMREQLVGSFRPALYALFGAVLAVLLIACVNLTNLLLTRATARGHEMALRAALGAGKMRLMRQLFAEVVLLVAAGGALGVWLAYALQRLIVDTASVQTSMPLLDQVGLDSAVIAFAAGATGVTALLCGLGPALSIKAGALVSELREGGRGSTEGRHGRLRTALVVAEVAVAVLLLSGAGMLIRSFLALQQVETGFRPTGVLAVKVVVSARTLDDVERATRFHESAVERLGRIPGVTSAAGTVFLPLAGMGSATSFWLGDRPEPAAGERPVADIRPITGGYFRTLGIPLLAGRDFSDSDREDRPAVAIVNETFARRYYPGESPLGQRLIYSWDAPTPVEIVGVAGDVKLTSLDGEVRSTVYLPFRQRPMPMMSYVLRTEGTPESIAPAAAAAIRDLNPNQPVSSIRPLDEVVALSLSEPRVTSQAMAMFAAVALLLAVIGVYGVVAYGVSRRLPEFGVRLALGARPADVLGLVLRQGLTMVVLGIAVGLALAIPMSRLIESLLFGVVPGDPMTLVAVGLLILLVAAAACYVPARRGTLVDPAITLRAQ